MKRAVREPAWRNVVASATPAGAGGGVDIHRHMHRHAALPARAVRD